MKKNFLFLLLIASLSTCKKTSENTPSKIALLTAKSWRISAYIFTTTVTTTGSSPSSTTTKDDEYSFFKPCDKDDFIRFYTDKTMVRDEGIDKCSPAAVQKLNYTWDFNSDQTKLLMTQVGSTYTETCNITELSSTTLVLHYTGSSITGNTKTDYSEDITYTAF